MKEKFIAIRLDDFHERCDLVKWDYLINGLIEKKIPCNIGIIAFNKDFSISNKKYSFDIWSKARDWQKKGINFWIHGYNHILVKNKSKFKFSNKGEFSNDSTKKIKEKINQVINLFDKNGIKIFGFFAPAHGYSFELIEVLKFHPRIDLIWDGYWRSPRNIFDLKFLPQQFWKIYPQFLRPEFSGVCLHPSEMTKKEIDSFLKSVDRQKREYFYFNFDNFDFPKITFIDLLYSKLFNFLRIIKLNTLQMRNNFKQIKKNN